MDKIGKRCAEEIRHRIGEKNDCNVVLDKLGIFRQSLHQWESGKYTPSAHVLRKLALDGYDVIWILTGERKGEEMKVMLDPGAKLPTRAHTFDAGLDLYAKDNGKSYTVPPYGGSVTIDTGVHVQIPQHFAGLVKSKSGLMVNNKILTDGTVDCDYTGSIHVTLFNYGEFSYTVEPGSKVAQLVIVPVCLPPLELVRELERTARGNNGFGSTGAF